MSISTALNWLLLSSIILRWGITAVPKLRHSYWMPLIWSTFLVVWLAVAEGTVNTYPLKGNSTTSVECLPPVDGAVAGIGVRISLYVHVFYILIQWFIGLFCSYSVGARSLSGGLLFVNIAFTLAVLSQYALNVLTFTDGILSTLVLEIQSNGLLLLLGTHEVRCKRWLMIGLFTGVSLSLGTMALFVGSAKSLSIGDCQFAFAWFFDQIRSTPGAPGSPPAYGFWVYFVSKCLSTIYIAWEAWCDAKPPKHLSSTSVLEFVVPMLLATILVERSAEVAATNDYLSETGQIMSIVIAGIAVIHAVWTTSRTEQWGLWRSGKSQGATERESMKGAIQLRTSDEETLNEPSMMEKKADGDLTPVTEQQFV